MAVSSRLRRQKQSRAHRPPLLRGGTSKDETIPTKEGSNVATTAISWLKALRCCCSLASCRSNSKSPKRFVTAADLDGDGDNDIIATFGADDQVFWYENTDGAGDFSSAKGIHVLNPEYNSVAYLASEACVAAVDLDNDGDLDLVASSVGSEEISWFENMDGEGTFSAANIIGIVIPGTIKVGRVSRTPNGRENGLLSCARS